MCLKHTTLISLWCIRGGPAALRQNRQKTAHSAKTFKIILLNTLYINIFFYIKVRVLSKVSHPDWEIGGNVKMKTECGVKGARQKSHFVLSHNGENQ